MNRSLRVSACLGSAVLALSVSTAWSQSTGSGSSTGSGASSTTAPAAQPGTGTRNTPESSSQLARADRRFIEDAAASGMYEHQLAQLAATRATDPAVKDFASKLASDHAAANSELNQLANSLGVELPPAPPRAMRRDIEKMGKKTGAEFDRDFVRNVGIKEHEKDIKRFQSASKDVKNPQLKAWIDKTLPHLQEHLAQAQKLPHAGGSASRGSGTGSMGAGGSGTSGGGAAGSGSSGNSGGSGSSGTGGTSGSSSGSGRGY